MSHVQVCRSHRGMTLVELLMAITVMGILTVLMLGSMSAVQSHVSSASNQANLMQLGIAMSMYTDDAGVYPPLVFEIVDSTQINVVARHERETGLDSFDASLLLSPAHRRALNYEGNSLADTVPVIRSNGQTVDLPVSYGYNIDLVRAGLRVRRMALPAQRVLMFDGSMSGPDGGGAIGGDYQLAGADDGVLDREKWLSDSCHELQLRWIDVLYADGHAERKTKVTPEMLDIVPVH